jgi:hypothetical protein
LPFSRSTVFYSSITCFHCHRFSEKVLAAGGEVGVEKFRTKGCSPLIFISTVQVPGINKRKCSGAS